MVSLSSSLLSPPEELKYFAKSSCFQLMTDKLFFTQNLYMCLWLISAIKFHCQVSKTSLLQHSQSKARYIFHVPSVLLFYIFQNNYFNKNFFKDLLIYVRSQDSAVTTATSYRLDERGVRVQVPVGWRIFSSQYCPGWLWGPPTLLYNVYQGLWPRGMKLTTHLQLVPRSRKCGSIHSLPHTSS
jgi:hypothetical protein